MRHNVSMIMAIGRDGALGRDGNLIWKIPEDLRRFKTLTMGHPVIMGRKTWDSLPKKPLPGRRNIVLTRNEDFQAEGAEIARSVDEALEITGKEEPFVIGGGEIYRAFFPNATRLYLTVVEDDTPDADTRLEPELLKDWAEECREPEATTAEGISYSYVTLRRK